MNIFFSTVSSGLNSAAVLILHDFILMIKPNLSQAMRLTLSKVLGKLKEKIFEIFIIYKSMCFSTIF